MYLARILTLSSTLLLAGNSVAMAKAILLLNDVASCAPDATPGTCLDRPALTSRPNIRFYK